jgi:hypothetical protein
MVVVGGEEEGMNGRCLCWSESQFCTGGEDGGQCIDRDGPMLQVRPEIRGSRNHSVDRASTQI